MHFYKLCLLVLLLYYDSVCVSHFLPMLNKLKKIKNPQLFGVLLYQDLESDQIDIRLLFWELVTFACQKKEVAGRYVFEDRGVGGWTLREGGHQQHQRVSPMRLQEADRPHAQTVQVHPLITVLKYVLIHKVFIDS